MRHSKDSGGPPDSLAPEPAEHLATWASRLGTALLLAGLLPTLVAVWPGILVLAGTGAMIAIARLLRAVGAARPGGDDRDLPAETFDVKLVIEFGDGPPGPGSYAREATRRPAGTGAHVEAVFTALDEADRRRIATWLERAGRRTKVRWSGARLRR